MELTVTGSHKMEKVHQDFLETRKSLKYFYYVMVCKSIYLLQSSGNKMKAIYLLNKSDRKIYDEILADDILGRQTVILKDASNYLSGSDELMIFYSGSDDARMKLESTFGKHLKRPDGKTESLIISKIEDEDTRAENGMGFLFG